MKRVSHKKARPLPDETSLSEDTAREPEVKEESGRRRNTLQRRVILEELKKLHSHPTAAELYGVVRRRLPRISLGTVYRNLDLFAREGLIRKLDTEGARKRFDGNPQKHCHLRCLECGRIDDLFEDDPLPGGTIERIAAASGFEIRGHLVSFTGICPACRERAARKP